LKERRTKKKPQREDPGDHIKKEIPWLLKKEGGSGKKKSYLGREVID